MTQKTGIKNTKKDSSNKNFRKSSGENASNGGAKNFDDLSEYPKNLRESEARYRTLFDSIDEGFCIIEIIYTEAGEAVDYRFVEVNRVFERQTGLKNVIGKLSSELPPGIEIYWVENYARVAQTGEPLRFEDYHEATGRWYQASASRVAGTSNQVAIIFDDITERKRREANLAFLAEVSKDLVRLTNFEDTMATLGEKIGEYFDLSFLRFVEIDEAQETGLVKYGWHRANVTPLSRVTRRLKDFLSPEFALRSRAGETIIVSDTANDSLTDAGQFAALGVGSFVLMPLMRESAWRFWLAYYRSETSNWRDDEIELMEEITSRIWTRLERIRAEEALQTNEARMRGQKEALQAAVNGVSLADSLDILARLAIEETGGSARAAFYIVNAEGKCLYPVYGAGNMSESYLQKMDGFAIGEDSLACGLAIPRGHPIVTPDVTEEPLWNNLLYLAGEHDFRACWSFPIQTRDRKDVGTFAMYFREPRDASQHELALAEIVTQAAAVIINSHFESQERARAEEALRQSNEKVVEILESIGEAFYSIDKNWNFTYINGKAEQTWGKKRENLLSKNIWEIFPGAIGSEAYERLHQAFNERRPVAFETFSPVVDHWVQVNVYPDKTGGITVYFHDISERKKAEEAVRKSEELFRLVSKAVPSVIYDWNVAEDKIMRSAELKNLLGFSPDDPQTHTNEWWKSRLHPEDAESAAGRVVEKLKSGEYRFEDEYRLMHRDGHYVWVSDTGILLRDEAGKVVRWVGSVTDITNRKQSEKIKLEKEILHKLVSAQEDERKRIARDLHDELGQQLTALRLKLESLRNTYESDLKLSERIDDIQLIAKSLDGGVDFLAWELRPAVLDDLGLYAALNKYVREWSRFSGVAANLLRSSVKTLRLAPETETNLYRIAQEALNNVYKHAEAEEAEVLLERRGDLIILIISDNGKGFDVHISESAGKGIGLIGMHERAQLIGGTLEIESAPGQGTTVHVRAPITLSPGEKETE